MKKIWIFIKTHWYIPLLLIAGVILKSKSDSFLKIIDSQKETYEKEKLAAEQAAEQKAKKKQKVQQEYEDAVRSITKIHTIQNKKLENKKKKEIKKIIKKHYNEPESISKEISDLFGVTYVPKSHSNSD
tara:strand:+ start:494 stop:880 length:387 start_codon:yes stop_codon:yes gene_type:complete